MPDQLHQPVCDQALNYLHLMWASPIILHDICSANVLQDQQQLEGQKSQLWLCQLT